jgi:hypothetical protein
MTPRPGSPHRCSADAVDVRLGRCGDDSNLDGNLVISPAEATVKVGGATPSNGSTRTFSRTPQPPVTATGT